MSDFPTLERSPGFPRIEDGYRVLATLAIAVPVWKINAACRLQEQKALPIFSEFVLKSVGADVGSPDDVATFLDLPIELILDVMASLYKSGYIVPTMRSSNTETTYRLTSDGLRVLDQLSETKPVQRDVPFHVDSLTGAISRYHRTQLLTGRQAEALGLLAIPSVPSSVPEIQPSDETEMRRAFEDNPIGKGLTLLSVVAQVGVAEKLFLQGQLVLSEASDGSIGMDARVFVDGRLSDERSLAFLSKDLLELLRAVKLLDADRHRIVGMAARIGVSLTEKDSLDSLVEKSQQASRGLVLEAVEQEQNDDAGGSAKLNNLSAALSRADEILYSSSSRWTHVAEHTVFLERAFSSVNQDLVIALPSFSIEFWRSELKPLVVSALASGVTVTIVLAPFEANSAHFTFGKQVFSDTKREMETIGCAVHESGEAELAALVVDSKWAVLSPESWGSSQGFSIGRVYLGRGIYLSRQEDAERVRSQFLPGATKL